MNPTVARLILQDRRIAYFITDRELNVVEVSGAVSILHDGQKPSLGHSLFDLVPELIGSEETIAEILAGEQDRFQLPWVNRTTPSGEIRYLTMADLPCRDRAGKITGLIHLVQDVTEMGQLEQKLTQRRNELRLLRDQLTQQNRQLAAANAELLRLDEMKSQFVSVAAHELRTPLASISGFVEMLLDEDFGPLNEEQREYLEIVQRSAGRLLFITNNLLDATRIEMGRIELVLTPVDLPALAETVAAEFEPQLDAKLQRLTLRALPGLPQALCDEARAQQIIGNLLSNANKYTPHGGSITISVEPAEEEGFLQVAVADNGVGIPGEDQKRLFDLFFRAKSAHATDASGAGLGLFITRSLVELHGGRIWVESEVDQGTTFYVTFPATGEPAGEPHSSSANTQCRS
ncbi:MAG: Non-motile and phage-resistance protein [Anaerolineales bacterium]|nr:Non-motile and phage-resistance protein [Anaerolineales bacterium]